MFNVFHSLVNRFKVIPSNNPMALRIHVAESRDELMQAFHLLYRVRTNEDYVRYDYNGLRVSPYHLLATTVMIVATTKEASGSKVPEKVIGTISIVKKGAFGLPSFKEDSKTYGRCAELFEVGVAPEFAAHQSFINEQLINYACLYALDGMKLESLLQRSQNVQVYGKVDLQNNAGRIPADVSAKAPVRDYLKSLDPVLNAEAIEFFFGARAPIFNAFSYQQKFKALAPFQNTPYFEVVRKVLGIEEVPQFSKQRKEARFETYLPAQALAGDGETYAAVITTVSNGGLGLECEQLNNQDLFRTIKEIKVQIRSEKWCHLKVRPINFYNFKGNERGFEIIQKDKAWLGFVSFLKNDFFPPPSA